MSSRNWGIIFLKLLGLYYLVQASLGLVGMAASLSDTAGFEGVNPRILAGSHLAYVVINAGFSALCLFLTEPLADWLFPAESSGPGEPGRAEERLGIGLILIVADHASGVARFSIELLRYSEASRQDYLPDVWSAIWRDLVPQLGVLVLGGALALRGRTLGAFPWRGEPPRPREEAKAKEAD